MLLSIFFSLNIVGSRADKDGSWDYDDTQWQDDGYTKCTGKWQSPIALSPDTSIYSDMNLQLDYQFQSDAFLTTNNKTLTLAFPNSQAGSETECLISGSFVSPAYRMEQMHFHWSQEGHYSGSEHSVNGSFTPLEVHFVHYRSDLNGVSDALNKDKGLLVVGTLFKVDDTPGVITSPIFSKLQEVIASTGRNNDISEGINDIAWDLTTLLASTFPEKFYEYQGSLTTPTCDQSVTWIVAKDAAPVTSEQLAMFRALVQSDLTTPVAPNYRPLQDLNARIVLRSYKTAEDTSDSRPDWYYDGDGVYMPLYAVIAIGAVTLSLMLNFVWNSMCCTRRRYVKSALLSDEYSTNQSKSMALGSRHSLDF